GLDGWLLDGVPQKNLQDVPHLDLGFTPATNMPQLRHAALADGDATTFDVAWFDIGRKSLERLAQSYRRLSQRRFAYESPATGYAAELQLDEDGFARNYPDLWERLPE
ncbi:MAG TPA: putative glycolipid-binding domain-containing protein, partial [Sphingomicrobium sp.]